MTKKDSSKSYMRAAFTAAAKYAVSAALIVGGLTLGASLWAGAPLGDTVMFTAAATALGFLCGGMVGSAERTAKAVEQLYNTVNAPESSSGKTPSP